MSFTLLLFRIGRHTRIRIPTRRDRLPIYLLLALFLTLPAARAGSITAWGSGPATNVPPGLDAIAIAASPAGGHALAILSNHTVVAWGLNGFGQTNCPAELSNVVAIAAGSFHNVALTSSGAMRAWGRNNYHQCELPQALTNVVAIAAGEFRTVALLTDGSVTNWGDYWNPDDAFFPMPFPPELTNVAAIACGFEHDLFLLRDGTVLTNGFFEAQEVQLMPELANVLAITTAGDADMALTSTGLVTWAVSTRYGQWHIPPGLTNISAIASGAFHEMVLLSNGTVRAWGRNTEGQCDVPAGLSNVLAIAGGDTFSLALVPNAAPPPSASFPASGATFNHGLFTLAVPTLTGRTYRLEYKNSLTDSDWTPLEEVAGDGEQKILSDSSASARQRFYRVRQQ